MNAQRPQYIMCMVTPWYLMFAWIILVGLVLILYLRAFLSNDVSCCSDQWLVYSLFAWLNHLNEYFMINVPHRP